MIVAHTSPIRAPPSDVKAFLASLTKYVNAFNSPKHRTQHNIAFIKERFGYKEEDIKAWLDLVAYTPDTAEVQESVILHTLQFVRYYLARFMHTDRFLVEFYVRLALSPPSRVLW